HPLRPLVWLANFLACRGDGLGAGQIVTTGSCAGVLELPLATPLDIRFGDLGTLSVQFIGMVWNDEPRRTRRGMHLARFLAVQSLSRNIAPLEPRSSLLALLGGP